MKSIDQRIKNGQSSASQGLYLENRIRRTFSIQKSKPSPFGHLNLIYWPIIALTLRIQRPIGDLAVLSSHPILDATSPRSSRRAPNQQRHKHCLLALRGIRPDPRRAQRQPMERGWTLKHLADTSNGTPQRRRRPSRDEAGPRHLPFGGPSSSSFLSPISISLEV